MECRNCKSILEKEFVNLYNSPPSNSFLKESDLTKEEVYYPLKVLYCSVCYLVQIAEYKKHHEIFNDEYVYFSSFSTTWLKHAEAFTEKVVNKFALSSNSLVLEVASNDGYLLKNFTSRKIPCLGVEPTLSTAAAAKAIGINTIVDFFGERLADQLINEYGEVDLAIANNVFAHVPDIHDFISGFKKILKFDGVLTIEFPHLLELVKYNQFDTIYHEHFSYFSLFSAVDILSRHKLRVFEVEKLSTHGGSLRIYICHEEAKYKKDSSVFEIENEELRAGVQGPDFYQNFSHGVFNVKMQVIQFLVEASTRGKKVSAYGAAAKGNTLLNFCGIKSDLVETVGDASPYKQNLFLPGSHIPVVSMDVLLKSNPDYIIILPWNLTSEIVTSLRSSGYLNQFVTFIPNLQIF